MQILSAAGWNAVYLTKEAPWYKVKPLALWVTTRGTAYGEGPVTGLVATEQLRPPNAIEGFLCYAHDRELTDRYLASISQLGQDRAGIAHFEAKQ